MIFTDQPLKLCLGFFHLILRSRRENHLGIQYLTRCIHNGKLTAGTECRIPAENDLSCNRRLHQKLLQVLSKYGNRTILCLFGKIIADFTLNCRCNQTLIGILDRCDKQWGGIFIIRSNDLFL